MGKPKPNKVHKAPEAQHNDGNSLRGKLEDKFSDVEAKLESILTAKSPRRYGAQSQDNVGSIVAQVFTAIKPMIIDAVAEACGVESSIEELQKEVSFLRRENLILRENQEKTDG